MPDIITIGKTNSLGKIFVDGFHVGDLLMIGGNNIPYPTDTFTE